jgi:DNA-binding ferritin-like protein
MSPLRHTLTDLLATLRAIHWHAWQTHWKAQGTEAYSDHLLFERIYSGEGGGPSINDQIDGLGERIIALFGNKSIDAAKLARQAAKLSTKVAGLGRIAGALKLEQIALEKAGKAADQASSGAPGIRISLDNFVRELADARSTVIYLLTQRLAGGDDAYGAIGQPVSFTTIVPYLVAGTVIGGALGGQKMAQGAKLGALAGLGLGLVRLNETRQDREAVEDMGGVLPFPEPELPSNVIRLSDHPDFGTPADEALEADFVKTQRASKLLGWAMLGLMGYVAYWNSKQAGADREVRLGPPEWG